jgi:phospholipase/carboxylesterase
LKHPKIGPNFR